MTTFMKRTSRRRFVGWAIGSLASFVPALSSTTSIAADLQSRRYEVLRNAMFAVFRDQEAARAVGERYLADHPEERDRERLVADLFGRMPIRLSARAVRGTLTQRRLDDFTNDQCVLVDNWVLARSEARACALVAML